jgi:hypothetical protein
MEGEGDPSASVSSRSGDMMQEWSKFESNIETEIESSKVHGVSYDQDARMMERKL